MAADLLLDVAARLAGRRRSRPSPSPRTARRSPGRSGATDGRLDPTRPAVELERPVRALQPWPGSFLERPDGRLIVHEAALGPPPVPPGASPGSLVAVGAGSRPGSVS